MTASTARVLVDTNVLIYAYSLQRPDKQRPALDILVRLATSSSGVLSAQVLAEFAHVATRKLAAPLSPDEARWQVEQLLQSWRVIDVSGLVVLEALRGMRDYQFSYWDAQIWAVAVLNKIPFVFSEDFNSGSTIEGVTFVNPFAASFDIRTYGIR